MANLSPARTKRIFSQQTITVQNDNTTSVAYNYIPWTVMVFMNGSLLDETDVNTGDGKNLVFTFPLSAGTELRIIHLTAMSTAIVNDSSPIGSVLMYTNNIAPPPGYMWLRKARLKKADYSELYTVIGDTFNDGGQLSDEFMLPDAEGYFMRAFDAAGTRDPSRVFGSKQRDAIRNIVGQLSRGDACGFTADSYPGTDLTGPFFKGKSPKPSIVSATTTAGALDIGFDVSRVVPTAAENRPINLALNFIIKVKDGFRNPALFDAADYAATKPKFSRVDQPNSWAKPQSFVSGTLTDSVTITWDASNIQNALLTLVGNRTIATPVSPVEGAFYRLILVQDATGGRSLGFSSGFKFSGGVVPTLPTTANARSILTFQNLGGVFYCAGISLDIR